MRSKLYNVIFPIWFLIIFPTFWLFVIPANFLIDSLVFLISLKLLKIVNIKECYKKSILKIWIIGFIADIFGSAILIAISLLPTNGALGDIVQAITWNPFSNIGGFLVVLFSVFLSGVMIYFLNLKFSLKKLDISQKLKIKIAIILAVVTAPYFFFYPSSKMYKNNFDFDAKNQTIICEYVKLGEFCE